MQQREFLNSSVRESQRQISLGRRRFLQGLGAAVALPALESLLPAVSLAADIPMGPAGPLGTTSTGAPLRMAYVYFPNGAILDAWWPQGEPGREFTLHSTLAPLSDLQQSIQVLGGLDLKEAEAGNDGGGDHARAGGSFLTGSRAYKSSTIIKTGVSIDQIAASRLGHLTPFRSLELSCDPVHTTGSCDSGYSCAYSYNISWRSPQSPVAPEPNPRLLFERMFGSGSAEERSRNLQRRLSGQKSIIDFVLEDARSLDRSLGARDQQKLDEYLSGLREVERRIELAEKHFVREADADAKSPRGIPSDFQEYVELMYDMIVLAFQSDQTRVVTFMLGHEGSNRTMPFIGVPEGHHNCSHHNNRPEMVEKVKKIDLFYAQQFAKFLHKLAHTVDVDGRSLLDNSMVCYGSGIADGNRHSHVDLPLVLAGGGGGLLQPGRYVKYPSQPVTNMYLGLLARMGCVDVDRHGDSTGPLEDL